MEGVTIGIAGWSLARADAGLFPPAGAGSQLERYAAVFGAVEINSSFYRPHRPETYARWADSAPASFRFAVKLPRTISHLKRMQDVDAELDRFAAEAGALGAKLGWVLVQTPPSLQFDAMAAEALFTGLRERFTRARHAPATCAPAQASAHGAAQPRAPGSSGQDALLLACEARHGSWFTEESTALLRALNVIRVVADPPAGMPGPFMATSDEYAYVRLHGSPEIYRSIYEPDRLAQVADWLRGQAARHGQRALVIFDNTMSGTQASQAVQLREMLTSSSRDRRPDSHK